MNHTLSGKRPVKPAGFPRSSRLTKTDEFSSVFGFRKAIKSPHFLLHYRRREPGERLLADGSVDYGARLGMVIGKRLLSRSVHRNLVRRLAREAFRKIHGRLPAADVVIRLAVKPGKPQRREIAAELAGLLEKFAAGRPQRTPPAESPIVSSDQAEVHQ